ncbi:hypothetical protein GJ496_008713 [Pomphorhynchus laevis]|nr:hypothetical protein GJ496_008713 [Pomphorhynchus laevis]
MLGRKGNYRKAMQRLMLIGFVAHGSYTKSKLIALYPGSYRAYPYRAANTSALASELSRDQTDLPVLKPLGHSISFA